MIYNELNKFLNRPEAVKTSKATSHLFASQLQKIAHEPPIKVSDLTRKKNEALDSDIGGISCLDQSEYNSRNQSPNNANETTNTFSDRNAKPVVGSVNLLVTSKQKDATVGGGVRTS